MLLKKPDNALLEAPVADRQHMVATLNGKAFGVRHQAGELVG